MKRLTYMALAVAAVSLSTVGCDSDADKMYVDGLEKSTLLTSGSEIVLENDNASLPAVTFVWTNESKLKIYGTTVAGIADKSMPVYNLQLSLSDDFANAYSQSVDNGVASFTVQELNTIVLNLGAKPFEKTDVYVRINTSLGTNDVDSEPSDAQKLVVTCYKVDYRTARMLDKDKAEVVALLHSADSDGDGEPDVKGKYCGFVSAQAWANFWLRESDGTVWGNVGKDASEFLASKDADSWNFWYPGVSGCYFTEVDVAETTETKQWTATLIPSLTISGDVSGEMSFVRNENRWMCVVTTTADNQSFSISGTGKKYDKDSRTDDAAATDTPITFGSAADNKLVMNGGDSFSIAKAGTYTVSLLLADYSDLKYQIVEGEEDVEAPAPKSLFVQGINDSWDFLYEMPMTDEATEVYTGVFGSDKCTYGYYFAIENGNYSDVYGGRDHSKGQLIAGADDNIQITTPGVYVWQVDWMGKSYKTTPVTSVSYSGLNDDWGLYAMTVDASSPSRYSAPVTITKASEWGAKIIINEDWGIFVGGSDGKIEYGKSFTDDQSLTPGDYTLTFDFAKGTYSFRPVTTDYPDALYAIGIDGVFNDDSWVSLPATQTGVYSGTITITNDASTEFEVYEDKAYGTKVGPADSDGNITTGSSAWKFWVTSPASGTYTLTINLVNNTWSITKAE
ncbi:MAG: DUF5114 domain-containing protein [Marinilabiliaceae bacterium]